MQSTVAGGLLGGSCMVSWSENDDQSTNGSFHGHGDPKSWLVYKGKSIYQWMVPMVPLFQETPKCRFLGLQEL